MKLERCGGCSYNWVVDNDDNTYYIEKTNKYYDIYLGDKIIWKGTTLEECLIYINENL